MNQKMKKWQSFVIGGSNAIAVRKAEKFECGKEKYRQLFIYGATGSGKTALSKMVRKHMIEKGLTIRMRYADDFTGELVQRLTKSYPLSEYLNSYCGVDVLILEDIQYLTGRPTVSEVLMELIDMMQKQNKRIWLTADSKDILAKWNVKDFHTVKLFDMDTGMKKKVLKQYAKMKGYSVSDEFFTMLADKNENIRTLQGMLNQAAFYQGLTRPFDEKLLHDIQRLEQRNWKQ